MNPRCVCGHDLIDHGDPILGAPCDDCYCPSFTVCVCDWQADTTCEAMFDLTPEDEETAHVLICTRPRGHEGKHVACSMAKHRIKEWNP